MDSTERAEASTRLSWQCGAEKGCVGREDLGYAGKGGSPVFERKAAYIRETASSFLLLMNFMKL